MSKIYNLLESLKLTSNETSELFSKSTRDVHNLNVYKDSMSDVIYIKDFFVGDDEYNKGTYRNKQSTSSAASLEDIADCARRIEHFYDLYNEKSICDFGCGAGSFLLKSLEKTKQSFGVELQEDYRNELNNMNIKCTTDISEIPGSLDTCFLFHVLEHLEDPIKHLKDIKSKLSSNGRVVIEVPHARDFLIKKAKVKEFIKFTLWSQHLILHTRESLYSFLELSGYKNINIYGVQRYSLANHIQWIKDKKPGGHRGDLKDIETKEIMHAYQAALNNIDATDTLIAIAEKS